MNTILNDNTILTNNPVYMVNRPALVKYIKYLTENILLFIPFGFLSAKTLAMCGKTCGIKAVLLASFMTSVSVEVLQYLSACGKSETEDIITNVLGAIIGYLFAKFVFHSVRK